MSLNFWSPGSNWEIVDNRHHVLFKVNSLVGSRRPPVGSMAAVVVIRGEIPGWRLGRLPPPGKLGRLPPPGKLGRLPPPGKGGPLPARGMPGAFGRNLGGLGESAPSTGGPGLAGPASRPGRAQHLACSSSNSSSRIKRLQRSRPTSRQPTRCTPTRDSIRDEGGGGGRDIFCTFLPLPFPRSNTILYIVQYINC